ncbi:hypothetical protein [Streptomyces sp. NPDC047841]|uniref:ATP-dependent DNA ligase n=1 Tax=Streptomyces sp. NPDC047841 TaxID=3154708 RepID=UPI003456EE23
MEGIDGDLEPARARLTVAVDQPDVPAGWAAEPKWDGFRALVSVEEGGVVLRSRRGTEMAASFPEIVAGAAQLPDATALDGELVVWDATGRLPFEQLQNRLARRGAGVEVGQSTSGQWQPRSFTTPGKPSSPRGALR